MRAKLRVPGGGEGHAAGVGGGGSPGAHAHRGIGHLEARQVDGGHGVGVHAVDAADELDLLLEGEFGHHGLGLGFDGRRVGHGRLGFRGGRQANKNDGKGTIERGISAGFS